MNCGIHGKPMKQSTKGWYCSTPVTKSADGSKVLEWCKWQPTNGQANPITTLPTGVSQGVPQTPVRNDMLRCNAMNNAVALAVGGVVTYDLLEQAFKRLLGILES